MPRQVRLNSSSGCYHIMVRGNAGSPLFLTDRDKTKYLNLLLANKKIHHYKVFAFCLLENQAHIVLQDKAKKLSSIMQQVNTGYAAYLHSKCFRVGHVFQGRYRSEPIEKRKSLLTAIRYVHNEPVKEKLVEDPKEYYWSSFIIYDSLEHSHEELIDKHSLFVLLGWERTVNAKKLYQFEYLEELLSPDNKNIVVSKEVLNHIWHKMLERNNDRRKALAEFYRETYLSLRELAKITGLSKSKIHRLLQ